MTANRSLTPSTLGRLVGQSNKSTAEMRMMAAALHHQGRRVAVFWLDEIRSPARLAAIETELDVQYGKPISGPTQKDVTT